MTRIRVYRPQKVFQLLLGSSLIPSLNRRTAAIGTNQEVTICIDLIIIIIIIITDDWTYFTSIINKLTVSSWLKLNIVHCQLPVCQPLLIFFYKNWTAKLVATLKKVQFHMTSAQVNEACVRRFNRLLALSAFN